MFSCYICEIFKNIFFYKAPPVAASEFAFIIEVVEDVVNYFDEIACKLFEYETCLQYVFPDFERRESGLCCSFSSRGFCRL